MNRTFCEMVLLYFFDFGFHSYGELLLLFRLNRRHLGDYHVRYARRPRGVCLPIPTCEGEGNQMRECERAEF